jgi:hypothetical protein
VPESYIIILKLTELVLKN